MTVNELSALDGFSCLNKADGERTVNGVYIGDLLSWVMGRAQQDNAWITIMSNINIIAVSSLVDCACIILAEGVVLDEKVLSTAADKGINVLSTEKTAYEAAVCLYNCFNKQ